MSTCRRAMAAVLREVAHVQSEGARPILVPLAAHHGVTLKALKRELNMAGIICQSGPYTTEQRAAHKRLLPHVALPCVKARLDDDSVERIEGAPPDAELLDACGRWGIDGAAEEYEVSEVVVCAWLRACGGVA